MDIRNGFVRGGLATTAAIASLAMVSCASHGPDASGVVRYSSTDLHAAHSEELIPVMHDLTRLAVVEPTIAESNNKAGQQRRKARALLGDIAKAADDIPDHLKTATMPPDQRALFRHMSNELRDEARGFRDQVGSIPLGEIKPRFMRLQQKCDACHRKFRIIPFPVSSGIPFD